ncbi:MAG: protein kinase [Candidatus Obscuribacterales bacterium]
MSYPGRRQRGPEVAIDTGEVVDNRFEIVSQLGEGGIGIVYQARHRDMDRQVALKLLKATLPATPEQQTRFRNEAQVISSLKHPNIVSVYSIGLTTIGAMYIAMELLDGAPLSELIAKDGALDYRRMIPLFIQACDALEHAHKAGIIHRDIKPSNLVITTDESGNECLKVVDFGLAKVLSGADITHTTAVVGSAYYMSPGRWESRVSDTQSDIYALGCSLFEVLVGRPPFVADSYLQVMTKHREEIAPRISALNAEAQFPPSLEDIVACCLRKDSQLRYQSVTDLRHDLVRLLDGKSPQHIPDAPAEDYRAAPPLTRPNRSSWIGTALGVMVITALGITAFWLFKQHVLSQDKALAERAQLLEEARRLYKTGVGYSLQTKGHEGQLVLDKAWAKMERINQIQSTLAGTDAALGTKEKTEAAFLENDIACQLAYCNSVQLRQSDVNPQRDRRTLALINAAMQDVEDSGAFDDPSTKKTAMDKLASSYSAMTWPYRHLSQMRNSLRSAEKARDLLSNGNRGEPTLEGLRAKVSGDLVFYSIACGETTKAVRYVQERLDRQQSEGYVVSRQIHDLQEAIGVAKTFKRAELVSSLEELLKNLEQTKGH